MPLRERQADAQPRVIMRPRGIAHPLAAARPADRVLPAALPVETQTQP
jgi:hypothetical protein